MSMSVIRRCGEHACCFRGTRRTDLFRLFDHYTESPEPPPEFVQDPSPPILGGGVTQDGYVVGLRKRGWGLG